MRWSQFLIPTLRETSKEAEATSHQLLLRGGYIRKLSSGVYSYLPLGFKVLQNVTQIIREEMNRAGAIELLLPALHPAEIWKQSGRYEALGEDKISFKNRSGQEFVLGPTHEEVITELASGYLKTYQSLPKIFYQIQTKFRDELRPRFGIIRTKEFIMKDAYSFDLDDEGLDKSYKLMYQAYERIFKRLNVAIDIVAADPGIMGGNMSHEFMVRSPYGEDRIAHCSNCGYVASRDVANRQLQVVPSKPSSNKVESFDTPNLRTIEEISSHFKIKPQQLIKTIIYFVDEKPVAVCVRGDREVHEGKVKKLLAGKTIRLAQGSEIQSLTGAPVGFAGPVGLKNITILADSDVSAEGDFVTGANEKDKHLCNVNMNRDFKAEHIGDLRYVEEGDLCKECGLSLSLITTMEVGHVFKLGTRYTEPLSAQFLASDGKEKLILMGCYGLGVNRIVAAIVEQHHDQKGIKWPVSVAPFQVEIITVNHTDEKTKNVAESLYQELQNLGYSCLYDDRNERAGVKFNDGDLIGIPFQLIVGERNLKNDLIEVKNRASGEASLVKIPELTHFLKSNL